MWIGKLMAIASDEPACVQVGSRGLLLYIQLLCGLFPLLAGGYPLMFTRPTCSSHPDSRLHRLHIPSRASCALCSLGLMVRKPGLTFPHPWHWSPRQSYLSTADMVRGFLTALVNEFTGFASSRRPMALHPSRLVLDDHSSEAASSNEASACLLFASIQTNTCEA